MPALDILEASFYYCREKSDNSWTCDSHISAIGKEGIAHMFELFGKFSPKKDDEFCRLIIETKNETFILVNGNRIDSSHLLISKSNAEPLG